jgi:hypothetical protein
MIDREKTLSEKMQDELEPVDPNWDENGLPENFTDKYHEEEGDE